MKKMRIIFPCNEVYDVPAEFIARQRAEYYEEEEKEIQSEIDFALNNEYEIIDWASNNMDWKDVKEVAQKVENTEKSDLETMWTNAEKKIIEE